MQLKESRRIEVNSRPASLGNTGKMIRVKFVSLAGVVATVAIAIGLTFGCSAKQVEPVPGPEKKFAGIWKRVDPAKYDFARAMRLEPDGTYRSYDGWGINDFGRGNKGTWGADGRRLYAKYMSVDNIAMPVWEATFSRDGQELILESSFNGDTNRENWVKIGEEEFRKKRKQAGLDSNLFYGGWHSTDDGAPTGPGQPEPKLAGIKLQFMYDGWWLEDNSGKREYCSGQWLSDGDAITLSPSDINRTMPSFPIDMRKGLTLQNKGETLVFQDGKGMAFITFKRDKGLEYDRTGNPEP